MPATALAAEIGTSAGVLMYLFGSKEALLAEPSRAGLMRLFFDNYVRSAAWRAGLRGLRRLERQPVAGAPPPVDVLATGMHDRVDRALSAYLQGF